MKIGLLITARLKSTRLPLKLLLDLNGKSVIERVVERAKKIHSIDRIILCTSTNKQDKPLVDIAQKCNIYYYLGSEEDVLQRLADASEFFGLDYLLSITGENPLFSIKYANQVVDSIVREGNDFTYINGLPIGCAVSGIKTKALKVVCKVKKVIDTEIWGPLINQPDIFKVKKIEANDFYRKPKLRITNDYFEDYQFLNAIYNHFEKDETPSLFSVINLINSYPKYLKLNENRKQASLSKEELRRIKSFFSENEDKLKEVKRKIYQSRL